MEIVIGELMKIVRETFGSVIRTLTRIAENYA
jgi:hypothetical protein